MRSSVRFSGMFIAEVVSQKSLDPDGGVKPLDFSEVWEEKVEGIEVVHRLKELMYAPQDWKAEDWQINEENEPMCRKASSSNIQLSNKNGLEESGDRNVTKKELSKIQIISSSTSDYEDCDEGDEEDLQPYSMPSLPSAADLKDLEDASTYTPNKKKVKSPVYIADLGTYLKSHQDVEKLTISLQEAETLIRRKAKWGTELRK